MKPKFYRKILKNGMTVIFEKRENPVVSVAFAVRCGGINETSHEKGISHFMEHMLYKGTVKRNARQIAKEIEGKGGILNGFTDELLTAYFCKLPSKHIDVALNVLGDMIKNPLFSEEEIEKEKKVIFEEIKMERDSPIRYSFKEIHKLLYKEPFGSPLIGTEKTLNHLNRKILFERFRKIYTPNNIILCVVGNTDIKKIVKFAEENFNNNRGKVQKYKALKKNASKIEKRSGINQANLILAYHFPTSTKKEGHAANVLNTLMGAGMSSRLFQEIREKRNLAYVVQSESTIFRDFSHGMIYAGTNKENVNLIKKIILEEFKKVSKELEEKELNRVKEQMVGNYQIAIEDSQNQMINLLMNEVNGNAKDAYEFEKNIRNVKLRDVKNLAKIKKYSFFALVPK